MKKIAQALVEFTFATFLLFFIFLLIVDFALYFRAKYTVSNIANEVVANVQLESENATDTQVILDAFEAEIIERAPLLNVPDNDFILDSGVEMMVLSSTTTKNSNPAIVAHIYFDDLPRHSFVFTLMYEYTGFIIHRNGTLISSGSIQSLQQF